MSENVCHKRALASSLQDNRSAFQLACANPSAYESPRSSLPLYSTTASLRLVRNNTVSYWRRCSRRPAFALESVYLAVRQRCLHGHAHTGGLCACLPFSSSEFVHMQRFGRGYFDFLGYGHQLFHVCTVMVAANLLHASWKDSEAMVSIRSCSLEYFRCIFALTSHHFYKHESTQVSRIFVSGKRCDLTKRVVER